VSEIQILPVGPGRFSVAVDEEHLRTVHTVVVPASLLDDLGLAGVDQTEIVRETLGFLLEREPATAILEEFSLETVASYFPEFYDELRTRLGA